VISGNHQNIRIQSTNLRQQGVNFFNHFHFIITFIIFTAESVARRRLFYRDISFLDWISTFIYKEIYEKFQPELITKEHINVIKTQ
jgi:hypothetical protein